MKPFLIVFHVHLAITLLCHSQEYSAEIARLIEQREQARKELDLKFIRELELQRFSFSNRGDKNAVKQIDQLIADTKIESSSSPIECRPTDRLRKTQSEKNGLWEYTNEGILTFNSKPIAESLSTNKVNLATPLGVFRPQTKERWVRLSVQLPLPDPNDVWVFIIITSTPFTEKMQKQGFYRVDTLPIKSASWLGMQLGNTPPNWVYAFTIKDGKELGYWIDPQKFNAIDWTAW